MQIAINQKRLMSELEALAKISELEPPSITRVVYSDADRRAREWFRSLCDEAGLHVRVDAIGNVFVRWEGSEPELAAIGTGSHIDAIPHAGAYDGTVGVLGGLEAIRALEEGVGSIEDIDKSMMLGCGHPMGPLTLLDFVGLDTTYYITHVMFDEFKEKRFASPSLLKRMVMAGWYGKKNGKGFYDWSNPENPVPQDAALRGFAK